MKTFFNFITYYFCLLFGIVRYRYYITDENGEVKRRYLKHIPTTIHDIETDSYYSVTGEVTEIINKTLVYIWLKTSKI